MAYVGTPIDTQNQFQSLQGKRFSGDASTTAFTLDIAPSSVFDIEVFVENVRQDPNSAYSLSGTTLTFAAAPPSGTNNIYVVHQAKAVGTISPAAGTVNADSFDNTVISGHTALAATPADTDEFLVSDAGTIKRIDFSHIKGQGKIAQVVSTTLSSAVSISSSSTSNFADISGLSVNITPTSSSSKIFISYLCNIAVGDGSKHIRLVRDSTAINIGDADASNQIRSSSTSRPTSSNYDLDIAPVAGNFLDSPSSSSQLTYKLQATLGSTYNSTIYINRTVSNGNNDFHPKTASTITVMEVLA